MQVSGRLGDKVEWSVGGYALQQQEQLPIRYGKARKRPRDLKLIGVAGFVYSEDEATILKRAGRRTCGRFTS